MALKTTIRRAAIAVAAAIFIGGVAFSIGRVPLNDIEPTYIAALLLLGAPVICPLGAAEFQLLARYYGAPVTFRIAFESTAYASAANLLPLPGGMLVRLAVLKGYGVKYQSGFLLMLLSFATWASLAFLYAGIWLPWWPGVIFLLVGVLGTIAASVIAWRIKADVWLILGLFAVRLVGVPLAGLRILVALWALGATAIIAQANIFVVSAVVGSAVAVVPAGLGVSEFTSAALAPLAGIEPAVGFLSGALIRATTLAGTAGIVLFVLACRKISRT